MTAKMLKEFGQINGNFLKDAFEMLTLSKMKYCGEICFQDNLKILNKVQYQFYKRFCHLKITTAHYYLIGEFGIKPMEYHFYKAALRFWLKLMQVKGRSIIRQLYQYISNNIEEKHFLNTWCWQIKKLLEELKLEALWTNRNNYDQHSYKVIINTRLKEYFREQWIESAKHSHKGLDYLELSLFDCEMKKYLNFIVNDQSVLKMLKIRTGNHTLSVEIDRYRNRKAYEECICKSCDEEKIEDLYHVIVECPKYNRMRINDEHTKFPQNCTRAELYAILNNVNKLQLKIITQFMVKIADMKNTK